MLRRTGIALLLAGLIVLCAGSAPAPASAHCAVNVDRSLGPETPFVIENPSSLLAIHATLTDADPVHYFLLAGRAGQPLPLQLGVPQGAGLEDFIPQLVLIGPGLPAADPPPPIVPIVEGGVIVFPPHDPPGITVDEDTGGYYWLRLGQVVTLPADGTYLVAVWQPAGQTGSYVFATGFEEADCAHDND